jgi:hypothetical protein
MTELTHDLALMLSGTSEKVATLDYYAKATRYPGPGVNAPMDNTYILAKSVPNRETTVKFDPNHRNMTIQSNDTFVRHRFIGHRDLGRDGEGIAALSWLLDEEDNMKLFVRNADTIILNSAAHDCLRNERTPRPDWVGEFSQILN